MVRAGPEPPARPAETGAAKPVDGDGDGIRDVDARCPAARGLAPDGCPPRDGEREGLDRRRLERRAAGIDDPIDTQETAKGRANNRRVEFLIVPW